MTGAQLSDAMSQIGWNTDQLADHLAQRRSRVLEWLKGERDIPKWAVLILTAATIPAALTKIETVSYFLNEQEHNHVVDSH